MVRRAVVWKAEPPSFRNVWLGLDPCCFRCVSHIARSPLGYVTLNKQAHGFSKGHRLVYWQHTGESPEVVMHLCDNPGCGNINHLRAGTHRLNVLDRDLKGRCRASGAHRRKFSASQVSAMRSDRNSGVSLPKLAVKYGASTTTVHRIVMGKTYVSNNKGAAL